MFLLRFFNRKNEFEQEFEIDRKNLGDFDVPLDASKVESLEKRKDALQVAGRSSHLIIRFQILTISICLLICFATIIIFLIPSIILGVTSLGCGLLFAFTLWRQFRLLTQTSIDTAQLLIGISCLLAVIFVVILAVLLFQYSGLLVESPPNGCKGGGSEALIQVHGANRDCGHFLPLLATAFAATALVVAGALWATWTSATLFTASKKLVEIQQKLRQKKEFAKVTRAPSHEEKDAAEKKLLPPPPDFNAQIQRITLGRPSHRVGAHAFFSPGQIAKDFAVSERDRHS